MSRAHYSTRDLANLFRFSEAKVRELGRRGLLPGYFLPGDRNAQFRMTHKQLILFLESRPEFDFIWAEIRSREGEECGDEPSG